MPHPRTGRPPCVLPGAGHAHVYDYGTYAFMGPRALARAGAFAPTARRPATPRTPAGTRARSTTGPTSGRSRRWCSSCSPAGAWCARPPNEREQYRRLILDGRYPAALQDARLPVGAKGVLQRALAPDPADRYQSSPSVSGLDFLCRDLEPSLA